MQNKNTIVSYLNRYAHPSAQKLNRHNIPASIHANTPFIVIPGYAENDDLLNFIHNWETLASSIHTRLCMILVLNTPWNAPKDSISNTQQMLQTLYSMNSPTAINANLDSLTFKYFDMLLFKFIETISSKESGVGYFRKLGSDAAVKIHLEINSNQKYIFTTDMDATIHPAHFKTENLQASAICSGFKHSTSNSHLGSLLKWYENHMENYRLGLKFAGSPFAWTALGSTLAFTPLVYAEVRGFPIYDAGEDFYFLNKISKIGTILQREEVTVTLSERNSFRTPFGTGAFLNKFANTSLTDLKTYPHETFVALKSLIERITLGLHNNYSANDILTSIGEFTCFSEHFDWQKCMDRCVQRKTFVQKLNHFHSEFDALKTLQWVRKHSGI